MIIKKYDEKFNKLHFTRDMYKSSICGIVNKEQISWHWLSTDIDLVTCPECLDKMNE